jgi:transcriptional regulator GlxA family with amidase domain
MCLLPLVKGGQPSTLLFVEHVFEALILHLAKTYGGLRLADRPMRGGLPAFQERRVKDMMMADLQSEPSLSELASSCGLSNRHFIRAFKASTGQPPHQWLLHRKIKRAQELLCDSNVSISDIAMICGFADQSHLTRMFKRVVGRSPALWRREKKSGRIKDHGRA